MMFFSELSHHLRGGVQLSKYAEVVGFARYTALRVPFFGVFMPVDTFYAACVVLGRAAVVRILRSGDAAKVLDAVVGFIPVYVVYFRRQIPVLVQENQPVYAVRLFANMC